MNIEYIDDKEKNTCIITDDEGKLRVDTYQDNMDDLLTEENIMEETSVDLSKAKNKENQLLEEMNELIKSKEIKTKSFQRLSKKIKKICFFMELPVILACFLLIGSGNTILGCIRDDLIHIIWFTIFGRIFCYGAIHLIKSEIKIELQHIDEKYELYKKNLGIVRESKYVLSKLLEQSENRLSSLKTKSQSDKPIQVKDESLIMQVDYRTVLENRKLELESMYNKERVREIES